MIFRTYKPPEPLAPSISLLWYVCAPDAVSRRERVLPTGQAQLILNLASDTCTGCMDDGGTFTQSPALLAGVTPAYTLIDAQDMQEMMGVVFAPGGLPSFFHEPADRLSGELALDAFWGADAARLRDRLREAPTLALKFAELERFLQSRLLGREVHPAVRLALDQLLRRPGGASVQDLCSTTGLSARRLGDLFTSAVGVGPKCFARIQRFRHAIHCLHSGAEVRWAELALDLGYYDQAHFANDFRAFSGLTPTAYRKASRSWANHVSMESATR